MQRPAQVVEEPAQPLLHRIGGKDVAASDGQTFESLSPVDLSVLASVAQGTAADMIKMAMLAVDEWLAGSSIDARMIMQVHDELVFEVEMGAVDELCETVGRLMSEVGLLDVPLLVEAGTGDNWDEAH